MTGFEDSLDKNSEDEFSKFLGKVCKITLASGKEIPPIILESIKEDLITATPLGNGAIYRAKELVKATHISRIYSEPLIIISSVYNSRE